MLNFSQTYTCTCILSVVCKGDGKSGNEDIIHHDVHSYIPYMYVLYIRSVQIFTIFVNESQTAKICPCTVSLPVSN